MAGLELAFAGDYLSASFALFALTTSLIPAALNRSFNTNLPWPLDFWLSLWLLLATLGTAGLYARISWWDSLLHFGGSAVLAYLAFVLIFALNFTGKVRLSIPLVGLFTWLTGVAFGALWEVGEFWVWQLTGTDTLTLGRVFAQPAVALFDTFKDLQLDLLGSTAVALGGMAYVGRQRQRHLRDWLAPFFKIFGAELALVKMKLVRVKQKMRRRGRRRRGQR